MLALTEPAPEALGDEMIPIKRGASEIGSTDRVALFEATVMRAERPRDARRLGLFGSRYVSGHVGWHIGLFEHRSISIVEW
jgi:hypothetical protein